MDIHGYAKNGREFINVYADVGEMEVGHERI